MNGKILRVLFDTNVYGEMFKLAIAPDIEAKLERKKNIVLYGCKIIRDELRAIPASIKIGNHQLRIMTLGFYDIVVKDKHNYAMTDVIEFLARQYFEEYEGITKWETLKNDFLIVATASLHGLDIICSNDKGTMCSLNAVNAYCTVNERNQFATPKFYTLTEFDKLLNR